MKALDQQLEDVADHLVSLTQELDRFSSDPDQLIEQLREEFVGLMQQEAELSNQLTALKAQLEKENQDRQNQAQEYQDLIAKTDSLTQACQEAEEGYKAQSEQVKTLLQSYQTSEQDINHLEGRYRAEQSRLFDLLDQKKLRKPDKPVWKLFRGVIANFMPVLELCFKLPNNLVGF